MHSSLKIQVSRFLFKFNTRADAKVHGFTPIFTSIFTLCLGINFIFAPTQVHAGSWSQITEKKKAARWTLKEWLEQKERNLWMDQWLMLHTPTPYEFALEVKSINYALTSENPAPHHRTMEGSLTAYATLVGIEFQTNNNASESYLDNTGLFHLRLLGSADQGSHFTISIGQTNRELKKETPSLWTLYLGQLDLTIYINDHFGLKLLGQELDPFIKNSSIPFLKGSKQLIHLFIDFEALRIFGGLHYETEVHTVESQSVTYKRNGTDFGIRIYF